MVASTIGSLCGAGNLEHDVALCQPRGHLPCQFVWVMRSQPNHALLVSLCFCSFPTRSSSASSFIRGPDYFISRQFPRRTRSCRSPIRFDNPPCPQGSPALTSSVAWLGLGLPTYQHRCHSSWTSSFPSSIIAPVQP